MSSAGNNNKPETKAGMLGTFGGVFTPSILTILGIILFLRMGYMVGSAGLGRALIIISIANLVSVLTSVSMSAAATNIQVKGGGAYYLISRTLGVGFGGAIGIILFLAQSVSIAFYCIGFGEALAAILPALPALPIISVRTIAVVAVVFLFGMAWLGADWATKFQYIVMGLLSLALLSFFVGAGISFDSSLVARNWAVPEQGLPFWVLFALFFPAVTGFTQGVNMSGDLQDPGKSIPLGTFWAVGLSAAIYIGAAFLFAGTMTNVDLVADYDSMKKISIVPSLITAGVLAATLSSAMASFLGAPRILQSLAADKIFGVLNPFSVGHGESDNPRRGVMLSGGIALLVISFGHLNLVAEIVSMFFLISYGLLNYATYYESRANSPFFRPRFKYFRPWMSLVGFLICGGAMIAIDVSAGVVAVSIIFAIYQYLKYKPGPARWADSRRSYYLQQAQENIQAAAVEIGHDRDWRPVILAMTNDSERLPQLMGFASWVAGKSGMITAVRFIKGQGLKAIHQKKEAAKSLRSHLEEIGSRAYPLVLSAPESADALPVLFQSFGIGPIKANTLMVNWLDELGNGLAGLGAVKYAQHLQSAFRQGLNVVILDTDANKWDKFLAGNDDQQVIDVWWQNDSTSTFMLLMAYLITQDDSFENARIRVISKGDGDNSLTISEEMKKQMEEVRIDAEPLIVKDTDPETIVAVSSGSSLVFMPFRIREYRILHTSGGSFLRTLPQLPLSVLVMAAQSIDLDAEPDEGLLGTLAAVSDELAEAQHNYRSAFREAERLKAQADRLTRKLVELDNDDENRQQLIADGDEALKAYDKAFRKSAKARIKVEQATGELEKLADETE